MLEVDKWITYTAALIPRVMDGGKTLTSRVIVPQPQIIRRAASKHEIPWLNWEKGNKLICARMPFALDFLKEHCPYGKPGTILGVREGYRIDRANGKTNLVGGAYLADDAPFQIELTSHEWDLWWKRKYPNRATPGRFMYRSLCRTRLRVLSVKVERLQDITEAQAIAEGVQREGGHWKCYDPKCGCYGQITARGSFYTLWDFINKKCGFGWDANPWVWRVESEVVK